LILKTGKKALFHHAKGNRMFLQNVDTHLSKYTPHHTPHHTTTPHPTEDGNTLHFVTFRYHTNRNISLIQIIEPTRCNSLTSLLLDVYVWLNMFRASPRPSSGARNCTRSLWFYRWRPVVGALLVMVWQVMREPARPRPTTLQPLLSNVKTRGS
jgi:hypothetical protein